MLSLTRCVLVSVLTLWEELQMSHLQRTGFHNLLKSPTLPGQSHANNLLALLLTLLSRVDLTLPAHTLSSPAILPTLGSRTSWNSDKPGDNCWTTRLLPLKHSSALLIHLNFSQTTQTIAIHFYFVRLTPQTPMNLRHVGALKGMPSDLVGGWWTGRHLSSVP